MINALDTFEQHRDELSRLAYRMLGSRADADDVVQEAYLRWSQSRAEQVEWPRAFLAKIVTRLCLDRKRELDARKETYIGPWLPEPLIAPLDSVAEGAVRAEDISLAFLYLLERLSPVERAAYLLRQVFDYPYDEIAEILEKSTVNCRQLVSRAEERVLEGRTRSEPPPEDVGRITRAFLHACATGDLDGLLQILTDDVTMISDGGGKAVAALRAVAGADRVARFFVGIFRKAPANSRTELVSVNGRPGIAGYIDNRLVLAASLDIESGRVRGCYVVRNPDKLRMEATRGRR